MCVDFAYKDWEQGGKKWAIRNIKLRTSRKLLFVAGLLMVFSCFKNEALKRDDGLGSEYQPMLQKHLNQFVQASPLDAFVWTMTGLGLENLCQEFLNSYEQFLAQINNPDVRTHLGKLAAQDVYSDEKFLECRKISHNLQSTLHKVFFEVDSPLREFTLEYGVF